GAHSHPKAVRPLSAARIRLKSPFSLHGSPAPFRDPRWNRTANVSSLRSDRATVSVLQEGRSRLHPLVTRGPWPFGLSPEFSTPVEKSVEKPAFSHISRRNRSNDESLGTGPVAHRNEGEPVHVPHVVPADDVRLRGPLIHNRARP